MFALPLIVLLSGTKVKPLFRDFVGLNVHTVLFKPELYQPVARKVRDYHGLDWDLGNDTSATTTFPMSRNNVDWVKLYGGWQKLGYQIDVSVMFGGNASEKWKDRSADGFAYGKSFAQFFGPSGTHRLAESIEIGNEPAALSPADYREIFTGMAKGVRAGDPKLKIVTCAVQPGKGDEYIKSIDCVAGLEPLFDVINVHTYAFAALWPTWRRSYPEDASISYYKPITDSIEWRNAHAPGKEIWVAEFGWDASTKKPPEGGDAGKWVGNTDEQQAQYIVRSYLTFSALDVDRAYLYWFNDDDVPSLHASSGLTRKYVPKPSFYAVAHMNKVLRDYRFSRVVVKTDKSYVYEFVRGTDSGDRVWAVWSPTGSGQSAVVTLPKVQGTFVRAERMPLKSGEAESVPLTRGTDGTVSMKAGEAPTYTWIRATSASKDR